MYRKTYKEINLDNLSFNVHNILKKYNNYKYYIGMVKADAYGHGMYIVNTLIKAGINYLAVSSINEAMDIRKYNKEIPILCTEVIEYDLISLAEENNITITVTNLDYIKNIVKNIKTKLTIHIKIDSGMNRLGVKDKEAFNDMYNYINKNPKLYLEGIYTHFATTGLHDKYYDYQVENFKNITSDINILDIPIVHLSSSVIVLAHPKLDFCNAIRIGTIMYGYDIAPRSYSRGLKDTLRKIRDSYYIKKYNISKTYKDVIIPLKPALKIKTNVIEIKDVKCGEFIGYGASFIAPKDMRIAILPIGYHDGIGTNCDSRYVIINGNRYKTVGSLSMCMMAVLIDDKVSLFDSVTILGDGITLGMISRINNTDIHDTLANIGKNLDRVYILNEKGRKKEIEICQ